MMNKKDFYTIILAIFLSLTFIVLATAYQKTERAKWEALSKEEKIERIEEMRKYDRHCQDGNEYFEACNRYYDEWEASLYSLTEKVL